MEKTDINGRFITAINHLIESRKLSKTSIAQSLGIKPAKFSEILNERMNVGTDTLALLCKNYSINASWLLLGEGAMLLPGELNGCNKPSIAIPQLPEFPMTSEGVCEMFLTILRDRDARFQEQADEIGRLKERIAQLEREKNEPTASYQDAQREPSTSPAD